MENAGNGERMEAAKRLLGNRIRFRHWTPGSGVLCTKVNPNGMVELERFVGEFSPFVFEIDGEVTAVPVAGKVH